MVLPQYACGLHCSSAGCNNAVFIMCNRHTASVWEDVAADGGCVPAGPLNGTELLILLKILTMGFFFLFYAFYFNKKNLSSQGDAYQDMLWQRKPLPFIISKHFL